MYQNLENNLHDPHDSQNFFDFLWVPTCIYCTIYGSTEKEHFLKIVGSVLICLPCGKQN